jgi:hypothetical protein
MGLQDISHFTSSMDVQDDEPPVVWTCRIYLFSVPAVWPCRMYLFAPQVVWTCRIYLFATKQ